ncbi:hypothetical protein RND71_026403 [Anisodus tanguticus]|uniref:Uncharacterized protein n=1 Tax=Anisodus tanguticus TaxID=243964 RepID=A0AAE1RKR6_9SOLA|nr:hypothetical protein RND71_026403 [Anisodus tanguticus]
MLATSDQLADAMAQLGFEKEIESTVELLVSPPDAIQSMICQDQSSQTSRRLVIDGSDCISFFTRQC